MKVHIFFLIALIAFSFFLVIPALSMGESRFLKNPSVLLVQNEEKSSPDGETTKGVPKAILDYEKEKIAKMKRNIGRRLMCVNNKRPRKTRGNPRPFAKKSG